MEPRELNVKDYIRILLRHKMIILSVFTVVVAIATIRAFSAVPIYMASAKMLIERDTSNPLSSYERSYWDPQFMSTQSQIIKSAAVGMKVVDNLDLEKRYQTFFKAQPPSFNPIRDLKRWLSGLGRSIISITSQDKREAKDEDEEQTTKNQAGILTRREMIARAVAGGIMIMPVEESSVVSLSYRSTNPEFATLVVNAVAKAYIDQILEMKMETAGHTIKWMSSKAEEERNKLEASEKALQDYMRANDIVTVENRITVIPKRLDQLASDLTRAESERKELETLYGKVRNISFQNALSIPDIASNEAIVSMRDNLLRTDQRIVELNKKYGPKHPAMIRAREERKTLEKKYHQEIRLAIQTIKNRFDLAKSKEENLRGQLNRTRAEASNMNERFIQYGILKRAADANRMLYDTLIKRMKEKSVTDEKSTVNVWMVDNAQRPGAPISPNIPRSIMLGIVLGVFAGCGLAFLIEFLDSSIKTPELLEGRISVPVFGAVMENKDSKVPIGRVMTVPGNSPVAENYKSIRTAIMLSRVDNPPKMIVISSVAPQEGKSTTSTNLSIALSQAKKKVLLIDGDLRRPQIHKILGLNNKIGMSSMLTGTNTSNLLQSFKGSNLKVLCSGPVPPNPSELLSSVKLGNHLKQLSGYFDYIIIDTPPVLAVSDALILGSRADGTLLVARAGKTTYEQLKRGIKAFQDFEASVLGVIINRMHKKKHGYYAYTHYDYYHSATD